MMRRRPLRRACAVAALAAGLGLGVSACGDSSDSPAQSVPRLDAQLDQVDDAIVAGDYDAARATLDSITRTTQQARSAGDLGASQADDVLGAVAALRQALPSSAVTDAPTPTAPTSTASTPVKPDEEDPPAPPAGPDENKEPKGPKGHGHGHGHDKPGKKH